MIREFFHSQILLISHMQLLSEVKEWVCLAKNDLARIFPCAVFHNDPIGFALHVLFTSMVFLVKTTQKFTMTLMTKWCDMLFDKKYL